MFQWCVRGGAASGRAVCLAAALCLVACVASAQPNEVIPVDLDQARLIKLPERAATVVIGDPLIADLSIQPGGLAVITGKGYGATNVIVLDKNGAVLAEHSVLVRGPSDPTVVVYRGVSRETYSCASECFRRITLGDDADYFDKTLDQAMSRSHQAQAAATPPDNSSGSRGGDGPPVGASGFGTGGGTIIIMGGPGFRR
jgi:hypothetical protein